MPSSKHRRRVCSTAKKSHDCETGTATDLRFQKVFRLTASSGLSLLLRTGCSNGSMRQASAKHGDSFVQESHLLPWRWKLQSYSVWYYLTTIPGE